MAKAPRKCCGTCRFMDLHGHKKPSPMAIYDCNVPIDPLPVLPISVFSPPMWPPNRGGVGAWEDGHDCPLYELKTGASPR